MLTDFPVGVIMLQAHILIALIAIISRVHAVVDVQVVVIGWNNLFGLSSLPFTRPAYEIAAEDANRQYNGTLKVTVDFVTETAINNCNELVSNAERMVAKWFYTSDRSNALPVLSTSGILYGCCSLIKQHLRALRASQTALIECRSL